MDTSAKIGEHHIIGMEIMKVDFEIIAMSSHIHNLSYLQKVYGRDRSRKFKSIADVKLPNSRI